MVPVKNGMKYWLKLLLVISILVPLALASVQARAEVTQAVQFYARVDYIVKYSEDAKISLSVDHVKEITPPTEPQGYKLYRLEVYFVKGKTGAVVPLAYDRLIERKGELLGVVSYSGSIKLACRTSNASLEVRVVAYYLKRSWIPLKEGYIEVRVDEPGDPFTASDMEVRISIDNYAPYAFAAIISPDGINLVSAEAQERLPPEALQVDLKHVVLNMAYLPLGVYKLEVKKGSEYVLPSAFLAVEQKIFNETVPARSVKTFTLKPRKGWIHMANIVVLYSVAPISGGSDNAVVTGDSIDLVFLRNEVIEVKGASFLVPPLNVKFWMKAYIVYGDWFKVVNYMSSPINVMYIPVDIKGVGEWTEHGVYIDVSKNDIRNTAYAYIVVQIPSYGFIEDVVSPSGESYGHYMSSVRPWYSGLRGISVLNDEAYVQVKSGGYMEAGRYFVAIKWTPITIKAVDGSDNPLANAAVTVTGCDTHSPVLTNAEGVAKVVLYKPGVHRIGITFKGSEVASIALGTITSTELTVRCSVYDLKVLVVGAMGQPLKGADVELRSASSSAVAGSGESGENGCVVLRQVPGGDYVLTVYYKRLSATKAIAVTGNTDVKVTVDVLFEIPGIGLPVSTVEATVGMASVSALTAALLFARRRWGSEEEVEIDVEE